MSFKYSVIGDNSQENREWLEKVGYKPFMWDAYDDAQPFITTMDSGEYTSATKDDIHHYMCSLDVNCIGNTQLFQAVSAIREDGDSGQWFTDGKVWVLCKGDSFSYWYVRLGYYIEFSLDTIHKATLTELQEKFKL